MQCRLRCWVACITCRSRRLMCSGRWQVMRYRCEFMGGEVENVGGKKALPARHVTSVMDRPWVVQGRVDSCEVLMWSTGGVLLTSCSALTSAPRQGFASTTGDLSRRFATIEGPWCVRAGNPSADALDLVSLGVWAMDNRVECNWMKSSPRASHPYPY